MTIDREAIRKRAEAATPAPWKANPQRGHHEISGGGMWFAKIWWTVFGPRNHADAEFIAYARTDVPAMLAEIARLGGERDEARTIAFTWQNAAIDVTKQMEAAESALAACREENERLREGLKQTGDLASVAHDMLHTLVHLCDVIKIRSPKVAESLRIEIDKLADRYGTANFGRARALIEGGGNGE